MWSSEDCCRGEVVKLTLLEVKLEPEVEVDELDEESSCEGDGGGVLTPRDGGERERFSNIDSRMTQRVFKN